MESGLDLEKQWLAWKAHKVSLSTADGDKVLCFPKAGKLLAARKLENRVIEVNGE